MAEKFWILESPEKRTARWDKGNIWRKSDYLNHTHGGKYISFGGPANRISELRVILQCPGIPDFIWTLTDCLARNQTLEMMTKERFTGFEARRAIVRWDTSAADSDYDGDRELPELSSDDDSPMFWEILVTGWGGMAKEESGVTRVANTNFWEGFPDWSRVVDWDIWDGCDFFIAWPFAFTLLVTDRVAEFIRKNNLTGVQLTSPDEYTRNYVMNKPGRITPMRLRDHFPDERARIIGEPLGIY
ncbi:hypothetical protein LLG46_07185 [bacterium]|nr:hypothetical protein [bacterium]